MTDACSTPGCDRVPVRLYGTGWKCPAHTPAAAIPTTDVDLPRRRADVDG